ncbi:hypothetical protein KLU848_4547 [Kluyveromyces marxianus]
MGLLDDVKDFASKHKSEKDGDLIDQAEKYIGEERLGQIKKKVGEENFDKYEHQAKDFLDGNKEDDKKEEEKKE